MIVKVTPGEVFKTSPIVLLGRPAQSQAVPKDFPKVRICMLAIGGVMPAVCNADYYVEMVNKYISREDR